MAEQRGCEVPPEAGADLTYQSSASVAVDSRQGRGLEAAVDRVSHCPNRLSPPETPTQGNEDQAGRVRSNTAPAAAALGQTRDGRDGASAVIAAPTRWET